ncbi:neuroligin-1 [Trichonephila clavipes]|nr:neuroligin-1 [Trichonephila clavipes]
MGCNEWCFTSLIPYHTKNLLFDSRGLFHRVILQSGSAFSPWALAHETMTFSRGLGRSLGCRASDHSNLIKCLRQRPLSDFKRVQIVVPEYLTSFGPMVDGIVIPADPEKLVLYPSPEMKNAPKIDVLMGFTRVESFSFFTAADERYGLEAVRRDRMLRTLVRNLFTFHLQEIFLTIVNEYTDWTRPVQHPVNILDGTIDAMTDALVVAPSVSSANLFSKMMHNIFLYVFNYPSDASEHPQKVTCVHGDDMRYVFGAPLVQNMAHFTHNYTKAEIGLSEGIMKYWTNFARTGNPNTIIDKDDTEKATKYEKINWNLYDSAAQSYLSIYGDRFNSCQVIYSQFGLAIHQNDHQARRRFVEWAQNQIAVVPDFHKRILFSDEAHFWLNGYVNKQNCRIWSEANLQVYVETPLHPEKLTVWCALFFKNDEGHNVTVNGDRYRAMITNFFIPELNNHDVQELWFQQDGATRQTARATIDLLKDTFGDRLISRFGPVNWPPRSCDLTPLDYFLWGYVKSLVYADKPQTLDHLEDNIHRVIADIWPQMLEKVIENWTSRLDYIRASRGSHMPEIIFKM